MSLPTTTPTASPAMITANTAMTPKAPLRLGTTEQFAIGIVSGGLSAIGLTSYRWVLCLVVLPALLLEVYEWFQWTFHGAGECVSNLNLNNELQQKKRLRQQYFGQGVISGTGVSAIIADIITQAPAMAVFHVVFYLTISLGWTVLWQVHLMQAAAMIASQPQQQQQLKKLDSMV
ncbi:expressed unknown protein [Seminavis robusta]|uniref:Uncharacterized protein n=1 Tax=Seminavis robusta TaxID=568900 RepID=A0A9N8HC05_9STRA|nr:expressed unknown protein [Seminavis robusta]|eukprot:Sro202_g085330.1 n/a (175) ;mRNA; f:21921-22445